MTLKNPAGAVEIVLSDVHKNLNQIAGHSTTGDGLMAVAQVQATCALVHAVRELTEQVRKLNQTKGDPS